MKCDFTDSLLHSYFDGELDTLDAVEFGRHVEQCADCAATLVAALSTLCPRAAIVIAEGSPQTQLRDAGPHGC